MVERQPEEGEEERRDVHIEQSSDHDHLANITEQNMQYSSMDNGQPSTSTGISESSAEVRRDEYKCGMCPFVTDDPIWLMFHMDDHID